MRSISIRWLLALLPLALLAGCSNNNNETSPTTGTMCVRMTDAPAAVQAVNLVVTEVSARVAEGQPDSLSGWQVLSSGSKTVNLLTLQNGTFTTIGEARIPTGTYTQVRLKLGAGSTVTVDGTTYPLTVPSGEQSGLKLNGTFLVTSGGTTDVVLDFDASRSIIQTGAGQYMLQPVIRLMSSASAGAIRGVVQPSSATTSIYATQGVDTVATALTNTNGAFMMSVLNPGTYQVRFHPQTGFRDTTLTNVVVSAGQTAVVDTMRLTANPVRPQ